MSLWSKLTARVRRAYGALLGSEEHLKTIAGIEEQLRHLVAATARAEQQIGMVAGLMAREQIVAALADPRFADPLRLERFGFRVHSQYDEDGIISEIFRRIGEASRIFVEFGAGNGTENCTGFPLMQGWRGLWIEADPIKIRNIERIWAPEIARGRLTLRCELVTVDTIDGVIDSAGFSGEIDLLAVDIDGNDYYLLEKISSVSPRVICAEYTANYPPHVAWTMARNDRHAWGGVDYRIGASLKALETVLAARGYVLVGTSFAGVNAFFVRKELAAGKFAEPFTAENHYNPWRFFYAGAHPTVTNWRGRLA